ncbi:energy-coupling factor transporter transmembrane protein EcfT [Rhodococcus sp. ABRD24]|uniref:energy-coupling factor transporter transmembrane component T family protein n=1 Tax=Rhodococcus sp. ABRD24 TaxID=2507582 RepID=UPI0010387C4E|nr:energy-coupling factor transporter transmembrane protein EcfT [Rhodococcus sp. ABRD24]QBJ98183.1 energy-coupling factor transporter transmembrane protein EcfT [Rhodococcus sp. ABRD24]
MTTLGLYSPGSSILHRMPAGPKLIAMVMAILAITVLIRQPWQLVPAAAVVAAGYLIAGIPIRTALSQLRPLMWAMLFIGAFQVIFTGWARAAIVCGTIALAVALAALVTLTTRVSDMLDTIGRGLRPLRRVGVNPDRAGLVLAMTLRCIPLLTGIVQQVTDARKARGLGFSLRALAVPTVVSALLTAEAMGEALAARGVDD